MGVLSSSVGSGAAGAAKFSDSDSRKYRYFDPKGKRQSHYEDVTVDVQPDPERYLIQDWIINFANGKGPMKKMRPLPGHQTGMPFAHQMKNGKELIINVSLKLLPWCKV